MRNGSSEFESSSSDPNLGFMESMRASASTWVALLKTRVEIISTEIEEARYRLEQMLFLAVGGIFFLSFGLLLLTFFIITLFWETKYRLHVLGGFSLLFLGLGIGAVMGLRKFAKNPKLFATTAQELDKDYKALATAKQKAERQAAEEALGEVKSEAATR
ncbi:MAG TPA: phage holin family protein [Methylomirabilota bacterium]|nr:phage holin family protein [Methylomirabilota bacterium]